MNERLLGWCCLLALLLMAFRNDPRAFQVEQRQFRSAVVLVPVDVRVLDGRGEAVTDLQPSDFNLFENGIRQTIAEFSTLDAKAPATTPRTFAIVLGRGRLNKPAGAMDAVIEFVRSQLLPGDKVGVFAYLRASDLTADHGDVVRFLERYRERHEEVEGRIVGDHDGRIVGSPTMPLTVPTQMAVARLFDGPGLPRFQELPDAAGGSAIKYHDLTYLARAVELLRHVGGAKHLLLLAEQLPVLRPASPVVSKAIAARVTLSLVQTGGVRSRTPSSRHPFSPFGSFASPVDVNRIAHTRAVAEETGGLAAFFQNASKPLASLAQLVKFEYLLGYYPSNPPRDGEFRALKLTVNRPGATVYYRHAFQAAPPLDENLDVRELFTESRIQEALEWAGRGRDIGIPTRPAIPIKIGTGKASETKRRVVPLDLTIDARRLTWITERQQHSVHVDIAGFVYDTDRRLIGHQRDRLDLTLSDGDKARILREGLRRPLSVPIDGSPAQVVIVVYEYHSDRASTATRQLR